MARSGVFIAGDWTGSGPPVVIRDPSDTRVVVDTVVTGSPDDLRNAVEAAQAAASWQATTPQDRAGYLFAAARLVRERAERIAAELVSEEGKTLREAGGEVARSAATLEYHAGQALRAQGEVLAPIRPGALSVARRRPVGPVVVISPFNFPLLVPAWKIGPALAHGNTVVWKPSSLTPLTAINLMEAFHDAGLPPGVLNLVVASGEAAARGLIAAPGIKALTFTGSTAAGRSIQARLAGLDTRVQLEMGGNNAAIVFDGVDVEQAAAEIIKGSLAGSGQRCTGLRRVIIVGRVEGIEEALTTEVGRWRVGPGMDPASDIGPLVSSAARRDVLAGLGRLARAGATVVTDDRSVDDEAWRHGHYVAPAMVSDLDPADDLACEEIFGPVLTLYRADSREDAFHLANSTPFGLSHAVFSTEINDALAAADSLDAGMVHVNAAGGVAAHVPFVGWGDSGFGPAEQGETAVEFFTRTQVINVHGAALG